MSKTLCIIDGHSMCYRAFFGGGTMTSPDGRPTNAVYIFARILFKLLREKQPEYLVAVFDSVGPTFRHEMYPEYKATRPAMPEGLRPQIPMIKELLHKHGVPIFGQPGLEADDFIAAIAQRAKDAGVNVMVITGDKDLFQILDNATTIYDPQKEILWDPSNLQTEKGLKPEQVVDFLSLMGDATDNVPGVPGIGEKTSLKLLQEFGSMDNLYANLDKLKSAKQRQTLLDNRDAAILSKKLVTLKTDFPLEFDLEQCRLTGGDHEALFQFYTSLGLRQFARALDDIEHKEKGLYRLVNTKESFKEFVKELEQREDFALSVQLTEPAPMRGEIVGIGFSWSESEGYYLPFMSALGEPVLSQEAVLKTLKTIFENERVGKFGHNLKSDIIALRLHGIRLRGLKMDCLLAGYLLNPARGTEYSLEDLSLDHLGRRMTPISHLLESGDTKRHPDEIPQEDFTTHAGEYADVAYRICKRLLATLQEKGLEKLYFETELPLVEILAEMEFNGIAIDVQLLKNMSREMEQLMTAVEEDLVQTAGEPLNVSSPKQLGVILFEKMGLPTVRKTKTGYSTDVETLQTLIGDPEVSEKAREFLKQLLDYRGLEKLKSTYVDALPPLVNPHTGRIHTTFMQSATATGRLSSRDPNLQNIPVKSEQGRSIRRAFVPSIKDWVFLSADYSQIELRMLAHFCEDPELLKAFAEGVDIHRRVAARVMNVPEEKVTTEMRTRAKVVNFSLIYGKTTSGLARDLGISENEAQEFIDQYFHRYEKVKAFLEQIASEAEKTGFVTTILGRRRYIPEVMSAKPPERQAGRRMAVNTVVQGSAADLIKMAMIHVSRRLEKAGFPWRLLLQIHDELLFETPASHAAELAEIAREEMTGALQLRVPLAVDLSQGYNWLDMK